MAEKVIPSTNCGLVAKLDPASAYVAYKFQAQHTTFRHNRKLRADPRM